MPIIKTHIKGQVFRILIPSMRPISSIEVEKDTKDVSSILYYLETEGSHDKNMWKWKR